MTAVTFDPGEAKPLSPEEIEELRQVCSQPGDFSDTPETAETGWADAERGASHRQDRHSDRRPT